MKIKERSEWEIFNEYNRKRDKEHKDENFNKSIEIIDKWKSIKYEYDGFGLKINYHDKNLKWFAKTNKVMINGITKEYRSPYWCFDSILKHLQLGKYYELRSK